MDGSQVAASAAVKNEITTRDLARHLGLFALTAGLILWQWPGSLSESVYYAAGLLSILLAHEMGHYVAARYYDVEVTLPYFLPGIAPFYTFGAFIKMRTERLRPEALMIIGAAGPLAGMVVAVPVYIAGLLMSDTTTIPELLAPGSVMIFGDSLLSGGLGWLVFGSLPEGQDVMLHPLAYAGWVGFFVTALNLVPIGQLDGGHIGRALFGPGYKLAGRLLFSLLVLCGALLQPVWLVLSIFLVLIGVDHPPIHDTTPMPRWARVVGYVCFVVFVLVFVPMPVQLTPMWELAWMFFTGQI